MRQFAKRLFAGLMLPVLGGPLKGLWWSVSTGSRFLRGTYGGDEAIMFASRIGQGQTVFDVGAHVGYFTVLFSKLVGKDGRVYAFEPEPFNIRLIKQHVKKNRIENIDLIEAGVAERAGRMHFDNKRGSGRGRIADSGGIEIALVGLDELYREGRIPVPDVLKMDVEGAEVDALKGAKNLLGVGKTVCFISTHGPEIHRQAMQLMRDYGYRVEEVSGCTNKFVAEPAVAAAA